MHTAFVPHPGLRIPVWAATIVGHGGSGVTLFFVASAFSLCRAARQGEEHGREFAAFVIRRFFRIAPLFYFMLCATLIRDGWILSQSHSMVEIAASLCFVFNLWPGHETGIVWASWTIGVEMLFYGAFPFLVSRAKSVSAACALVAAALLGAALWPEFLFWIGLPQADLNTQAQYGLIRHLPVFALGLLAYRLFEKFIERTKPSFAIGKAFLLFALYLYVSLLSGILGTAPFLDSYYWQAIIYGAVVLGAAIYPSIILVNPVTRYVGRVSYSLYLLHPMIVYALIPFYRMIESSGWLPTFSYGICAATTLGITVAIASLTYAFIEMPFIRLGSRLASRISGARPTDNKIQWTEYPDRKPPSDPNHIISMP